MSYESLAAEVVERAVAFAEPEERDKVEALARAYVARLPRGVHDPVEQIAATVVSLTRFIEHRPDGIKVRAFNPDVATDGYETAGSVIEINLEDAPFLLDSVSNEVQAHGLQVEYVVHPVIGVERDAAGDLVSVRHARHTITRESVQHYELDRRLFDADLPGVERSVHHVLENVRCAVSDFHPMAAKVDRMIEFVRVASKAYPEKDVNEAVAFLQWLKQDNYIFLGYREYALDRFPDRPAEVHVVPNTGLGILSEERESRVASPVPVTELPAEVAERYLEGPLLVITKTNQMSPVHRRVKMDYIGVRIIGQDGRTAGEARLVGLFTSKAYMEPAADTPIIRRKLHDIVAAEDLIEGSHDHKALTELLEGFSKHDLFTASPEGLRDTLMGLLALQEHSGIKLFVRRDLLERGVHVVVAIPKDRFNATLRQNLQDLFVEWFKGRSVDYHLALGEGEVAQLHFTVWVEAREMPEVRFEALEQRVLDIARSWTDRLADELEALVPRIEGLRLAKKWGPLFPEYYVASTAIEVAAADVVELERLEASDEMFIVGIHNESERQQPDRLTRVTLYRKEGKRPLNELLPALVDLGLEVVEEVPTRLEGEGELFIHDFGVLGPGRLLLDADEVGDRLCTTLESVWSRETETDSLNRLVILGGLDVNEIEILRAYRTYWRRVMPVFTVGYVDSTLVEYTSITANLVQLFQIRFDPDLDPAGFDALREEVLTELDGVPSLEEDRILRSFLRMIEATTRTNAYCANRRALALKLRSADVPDAPLPHPMAEIFVIAPTVEGIHLRGGMVARGGIRWSTRREDYRTEVLGLMKAQMTKNAVIVPKGAKGGFVLRRPPDDPAELRDEVAAQYEVFIGALLDVTDNRVGGEVVHPDRVRVHDPDDPYLVVAADKGTATFSDLANRLARDRGFWLDDAFASGGSEGYDHKQIGITARGAWQSLLRHFFELGIDPAKDPFTVVGIGDMSGDVFGNGMLLSDQIQLIAAFDHRHIFLDPHPDPAAAFAERTRMFARPRSSWADYDESLISEGGGVYPRSAKKIELSAAMAERLGIRASVLTPAALIQAILRAPVELLWNGGIGTYVKASHESQADVGDRGNDPVRIDGNELRAKVVVEGGNLGLTQAGRIEYASNGGRINTDFIDNSAGVDCSDREVNLKILLSQAEREGRIDRDGRNRLVAEVVDDVVERILYDNFEQAQMLSQEQAAALRRMEAYEEMMSDLTARNLLDRQVEGLPSSDEMMERSKAGKGLTRPELSVLLAYAKIDLERAIAGSELPNDPYLVGDLRRYFPEKVVEEHGDLIANHPLRSDLVATLLANDCINSEGVVFVFRLGQQTGAAPDEVAGAYRVARDVTRARERRAAIEASFGTLDMQAWYKVMRSADLTVENVARWYLSHAERGPLGEVVEAHRPGFDEITDVVFRVGPEDWRIGRSESVARLRHLGAEEHVAIATAALPALVYGPDVIEVAEAYGKDIPTTLDIFLRVGRAFGLDHITELARSVEATDKWQRWALWTVEEELLSIRRRGAERVLDHAGSRTGEDAVMHLLNERSGNVARLTRFMRNFDPDLRDDLSPLMVALRQTRAVLA